MRCSRQVVGVLGVIVIGSTFAAASSPVGAISTSCQSEVVASTLGRRDNATLAASDRQLVVWGGDRGTGNAVVLDGKVLDLTDGGWTDIVPRPQESNPVAVHPVASRKFLLTGAQPSVYNTDTKSWSAAPIPITKNRPLFAATPHGIIAIPWHARTPAERSPLLLDQTGTAVTRVLPDAPTQLGLGSRLFWVGSRSSGRAVVLRTRANGTEVTTEPQGSDVVLDVQRGRWSSLPEPPVQLDSLNGLVASDGLRIFALGVAPSTPNRLSLVSWKPGETAWRFAGLTKLPAQDLKQSIAWRPQLLAVGDTLAVIVSDEADPTAVTLHLANQRGKIRRVVSLSDIATQFTVAGERLAALRRDGSVEFVCVR